MMSVLNIALVTALLLIVTVNGCSDSSAWRLLCFSYRNRGYCSRRSLQYRFMMSNCKRTCGLCRKNVPRQTQQCADKVPQNCPRFRSLGYCFSGRYKRYMMQNCRKTCGVCKPTVNIQSNCKDSSINGKLCPAYRSRGYCKTWPTYMRRNCKKTCRFCGRGPCRDLSGYESRCKYWKKMNYCLSPRHSMSYYCAKTCEFCIPMTPKPMTKTKEKRTKKVTPATTTATPTTVKKFPISNEKCGKNKKMESIVGRIVGGSVAEKNSWIWQVGMYQYDDFICGGSLISPRYVVTAAHCVKYRQNDLIIRAGDHRRDVKEDTEQESEVEAVMYHEDYSGRTINNDIALLKLKKPFTLNDNVGTVCLPKSKTDAPAKNSVCYVTGWGRTGGDEGTSEILKEAKMPIVPKDVCKERNKNDEGVSKVNDNMICGGYRNDKIESGCQGDSGGPYVCKTKNNKWVLQGIVSWGSRYCDVKHRFTVFTKVRNYLDWIGRMKEY